MMRKSVQHFTDLGGNNGIFKFLDIFIKGIFYSAKKGKWQD